MRKGSMRILEIKRFTVLFLTFSFFIISTAKADTSHYKELLVSDRASNLGGAYSAVSDDASGGYYNPAGLVFGANNSMTSLSNTTNFVSNKYDNAVGGEAEEEEDWRYLINFAGYMKRLDSSIIGISYAIDDSTGVRQNQEFDNGTVINKTGDDRTYKYGPSWAYQIEEYLSIGTTVYLYQREYFVEKSRLNNTTNAWTYETEEGSELGLNFIAGLMWLPIDEFSIGLVVKQVYFTHAEHHQQSSNKAAASTTVEYNSSTDNTYRKMPLTTTLGFAWFPSTDTLITCDLDYHMINEENKVNVLNISAGIEYYLADEYVVRGGFYTNNDNDIAPSASTTNTEKIDMKGVTFGFSIFNGPSTMITAGGVFSVSEGKAQVDPDNPSDIQKVTREVYSYNLSVSINFD